MPTASQIITKIDARIDEILTSSSTVAGIADYRLGEKEVDRSQILAKLLDARKLYQELDEKDPYEDIRHIALDHDEFGVDVSEYIGQQTVGE